MLLPEVRKGKCKGDWQPAYSGAFLEDDQKPGLVMSLDYDIAIMFRKMVAGNACVSATRWKRVLTVSGPVLRSAPWRSSPSPLPPSSPTRGEEGGTWGARATEYWQSLT